MRNLVEPKERKFNSVIDYSFDKRGTVLIVKTIETNGAFANESLNWVDLVTGKMHNIWKSDSNLMTLGSLTLDVDGNQLAFKLV